MLNFLKPGRAAFNHLWIGQNGNSEARGRCSGTKAGVFPSPAGSALFGRHRGTCARKSSRVQEDSISHPPRTLTELVLEGGHQFLIFLFYFIISMDFGLV